MEVKTNNFTCIYAGGFFRICDEQFGTFWIPDSFFLYTKMDESEIKMSQFGRVSGTFKPNKVLASKNPCESEYFNFANGSSKKNACKRSRCWETDIKSYTQSLSSAEVQ